MKIVRRRPGEVCRQTSSAGAAWRNEGGPGPGGVVYVVVSFVIRICNLWLPLCVSTARAFLPALHVGNWRPASGPSSRALPVGPAPPRLPAVARVATARNREIQSSPGLKMKHLDKAVRSASSRTRPRRTTSASPFSAAAPSPADVFSNSTAFSAVNMMGALKCDVEACGANV